jgi:hypothetical protein
MGPVFVLLDLRPKQARFVQDAALAREDGNVAEARALLKKVLAIAREFSFARTELARLEAIERQLSEPAKKK